MSDPLPPNDTGHCEMLRAMYDFTSTSHYAKSLTFHTDDVFIFYEINTKKRQWWEVVDDKGNVGYVPSNYVNTIQVTLKYFLQFLDGCIQVLAQEEKRGGGSLRAERQKLLHFLLDRRLNIKTKRENSVKKNAPHPLEQTKSSGHTHNSGGGHGDGDLSPFPSCSTYASVYSASKHRGGSFSKQHQQDMTLVDKAKIVVGNVEVKTTPHIGKNSNSVPYPNAELKGKPIEKAPHTSISSSTIASSNSSSMQESLHNNGCNNSTGNYCTPKPLSVAVDKGTKKCTKEDELLTSYNLVEQVRRHTDLSHELSRVAVGVIVARLQELLTPEVEPQHCLSAILTQCQGRLEAPRHMIEETFDAARLQVIFTELTSCKEDSQQRSWMLHEDEATIIEYINELTAILTNADPSISRHMMSLDHYNSVSTLVQFYQMEVRWSIRRLLLQTFGVMCSLDATIVTLMLNSILPMELARDMQANAKNVPRLMFSSLLLTMIFSMAEAMPIAHLEYLGLEFLSFLLDLVESPPDMDTEDQIPDRFLNLILSYNLQFSDPLENCVLKALEERENAKTFTEKALVLINREEDPVRVFDHTPAPPNAVLKLFIDLFSNTKTALLFYTNDVKVLIDIIARQLADLSAGDKRRGQYLEMCKLVMRNSNYQEHLHRCDDLLKCFTRIFCEETDESFEDQRLVRIISNEFPQYFKS